MTFAKFDLGHAASVTLKRRHGGNRFNDELRIVLRTVVGKTAVEALQILAEVTGGK